MHTDTDTHTHTCTRTRAHTHIPTHSRLSSVNPLRLDSGLSSSRVSPTSLSRAPYPERVEMAFHSPESPVLTTLLLHSSLGVFVPPINHALFVHSLYFTPKQQSGQETTRLSPQKCPRHLCHGRQVCSSQVLKGLYIYPPFFSCCLPESFKPPNTHPCKSHSIR